MFSNFVISAIRQSLKVIGEPANIGGNQFEAAFDEMEMTVDRNIYGDTDQVTARATCVAEDLDRKPEIGETLQRVRTSVRYVILNVQEDEGTYELHLREK